MRYIEIEPSPLINLPLAFGLLLSFVVHFAIFLSFSYTPKFQERTHFIANVSFEAPLREPRQSPLSESVAVPKDFATQMKRQIVSSPDNQNEASKSDIKPKHFLESEKDATTDHEQIKRGSGKDAGLPGPKISNQSVESSKNIDAKQEARKQPNIEERAMKLEDSQGKDKARERAQGDEFSTSKQPLRQLKLDEGTVFEKFAMNQKPQSLDEKIKGTQNSPDMSAYQPFSRPYGSGARFLGDSGITDYLPNLPDGDITLLNTKANKFAVFVSRVATQVFSQMRAGGLESISTQEILNASDFNVVKARLSLKGELLSVSVEKGSGSKRFDDILLSSAQLGAKDPNPPADAASSDGSIQFIFQSRIWGEISSSSRSGMPFRRIWLLLATGLE